MLEAMWDSRVLSNRGPFHERFEQALSTRFEAPVSLVNNGMLALSCALEAAKLHGEVVTTPYSFVATTHSLVLANLEPVFADVRAADCNLDPAAVEAAITPRTSAILAVHCYGNPCDVDALQAIADRHSLALIYDAAHAFGVDFRGRPLVAAGDFSTLSFHATKAFNTFEGGAVVAGDPARKAAVDLFRNFGIEDEVTIPALGTNAKMNEFNAAIGLLQLERFEEARAARASVAALYRELLGEVAGLRFPRALDGTTSNHGYFPIFVEDDFPLSREQLYDRLKADGIYTRRYFSPCLASLPMYSDRRGARREEVPNAFDAAERVLCLPIYEGLEREDIGRAAEIIRHP